MKRIVAATVVLSVVALCADAPATIHGRVVADATGDPVPNARVSLISALPGTPVVLADGDGRFMLRVPAGRITLVASKSGYARRTVTAAASDDALDIRLHKGAAIVGRVVDEFGDPIASARVSVEAVGEAAGRGGPTAGGGPPGRIAPSTGTRAIATAETDDLGEYRIGSLPAGLFVVAATTVGPAITQAVNNDQMMFGPSVHKLYHPGVDGLADAQPLRLQPGDDRRGIDFTVDADRADNPPDGQIRVVLGPGAFRRPEDAVAPPATGVVRGRVAGTGGRALPHALVRLLALDGRMMPLTVRADESGDFEFQEVPAGKYRAVASKVGYSNDRSVEPVIVDLGDGQTRERVEIRLARWGTIEGRVLDETGDPLQGASVQVLQMRYVAGQRRLAPASSATRTTDDLGHYRLYGLAPGQYIVSAAIGAVSTADLPGYSRSYFPGTPNPGEAQFVPLALSQDVTGVDVMMARARTARVLGKILGPDGEPSMAGSLTLFPSQRSMSVTSVPVGARILPDGRFEFPNVAPGQYIVQAYRGRKNPSTEGEFGALPVTVDGVDVANLVLQTTAGSSIAGRFTFDASLQTKMPRPGAIELSPIPVDFDASPQNNFASAEIHDDWTFEINGVSGPRRLQLLRAPSRWALKEIRVNGIEATDRSFAFGRSNQSLRDVEVVLTDRVSEVAGRVTDARGTGAPGTRLIVFPSDRDRWYPGSRFLRQTTTGPNGAFSITGLAYGSYYAAAVARPPAGGDGGWQDPEFLESLVPRASSVTVRDGEKQTLGVRLSAQ